MKFFSMNKFAFIISLSMHAAILWIYYPDIIGSKSFKSTDDTILISLVTIMTKASESDSSSEIRQETPFQQPKKLRPKTQKMHRLSNLNLATLLHHWEQVI